MVRHALPEAHPLYGLAADVLTGAAVYSSFLLILAGRRLLRIRDLILKRGAIPS
jgi:teichuronic acid exporter